MTHTEDVGAKTWGQFDSLFMEQYFPETKREARREEFERLIQGNSLVALYECKFADLSRYATYMVDTEAKKIHRFVRGLRLAIQT